MHLTKLVPRFWLHITALQKNLFRCFKASRLFIHKCIEYCPVFMIIAYLIFRLIIGMLVIKFIHPFMIRVLRTFFALTNNTCFLRLLTESKERLKKKKPNEDISTYNISVYKMSCFTQSKSSFAFQKSFIWWAEVIFTKWTQSFNTWSMQEWWSNFLKRWARILL